jgi:adenine-specific DNA-methyltransferase
MLPGDSPQLRKQRGAFFTPPAIAEHLAEWALRGIGNEGRVLDPTCGEGVFLIAAAEKLRSLGRSGRLLGLDLHGESLAETMRALTARGFGDQAELLVGDFFEEATPGQLGARIEPVDAVIGNPPFVRYHEHRGEARKLAAAAALAQGVRLSGLASSWAALLVHASSFLKPDGRITMVLPAELLSVGYAEPVRQWLKRRFASVHLVLFEHLQFHDAEEQVVLLVARGSGGCNAFSLHHVRDAEDLDQLHIYDADAFAPRSTGKWTDLLLPGQARGLLRDIVSSSFQTLATIGTVELGTVTGANGFFTMSEGTRVEYGLVEGRHLSKCVPPGSRHLKGLHFTTGQWEELRLKGERVWMLNPTISRPAGGFARYLEVGRGLGVPAAYKCTVRDPWWKPPVVAAPDLFFTYMSHVGPRMVRNDAGATLVNSLHGVRLANPELVDVLPTLGLNSITMVAAEIVGRSYGGGILKMEPREAGDLPLPATPLALRAWKLLEPRRSHLDELVRVGRMAEAASEVDDALVAAGLKISAPQLQVLRSALSQLRTRRQRKEPSADR